RKTVQRLAMTDNLPLWSIQIQQPFVLNAILHPVGNPETLQRTAVLMLVGKSALIVEVVRDPGHLGKQCLQTLVLRNTGCLGRLRGSSAGFRVGKNKLSGLQ